jgi:hypothetical protein
MREAWREEEDSEDSEDQSRVSWSELRCMYKSLITLGSISDDFDA